MFGFGKNKVHKSWLPAKATILADEGQHGMAINSATQALQQNTYIIEVRPQNGDPKFNTEVSMWVSWPNLPSNGDVLDARYKPGTKDAELAIEGDPRFDAKLVKEQHDAKKAAERAKLLGEKP